jgi:hypothetical protein
MTFEKIGVDGSTKRMGVTDVGDFSEEWFKNFVESYRCRVCKKDLNLNNFGGLGSNHGIFCNICFKNL